MGYVEACIPWNPVFHKVTGHDTQEFIEIHLYWELVLQSSLGAYVL